MTVSDQDKPLRIAVFTDSLLMHTPDGRIWAVRDQFPQFISRLADDNTRVMLIARSMRTDSADPESEAEFLPEADSFTCMTTAYFRDAADGYLKLPLLWRQDLKPFRRALNNADIVLLRVRHHAAPLIALMARNRNLPMALWWAAPLLASIEKNYEQAGMKNRLARAIGRYEESVLARLGNSAAVNFFLDEAAYNAAGMPANACWPVPNLVSQSDFVDEPAPRANDTFTICFAGRLMRHKGIFDLLTGFEALADEFSHIRLSVAGTGTAEDEFRRAAQASRHAARIGFAGHLRRQAVLDFLKQADLMVLPSYAEGLPKVLWECWSMGTPVIVTDVGGLARFARNNENALMFPPGDMAGLIRAMRRMISDEDARHRIASSGLETARAYSWEGQINYLRRILAEAAGQAKISGK
jgi:glycosyltransferase involved in cell wall biosynthesis